VGINLIGLAALVPQLVVYLAKSGWGKKSMCLAAALGVAVAAAKLLLERWRLGI
jgi:hypothetical protein